VEVRLFEPPPLTLPEDGHAVLAVDDDLVLAGPQARVPHIVGSVHGGQHLPREAVMKPSGSPLPSPSFIPLP